MGVRILNVQQFLEALSGARLDFRESADSVVVGVASAPFMLPDSRRAAFCFVNLSLNDMYLRPNGAASATKGIRVGPSGGSLVALATEIGIITGYEWQAIATAAASSYYLIEALISSAPAGS